MDRLAKKCVLTSAIVHGTLVLVLIVGPAFLGSDSNPEAAQPILTIIPDIAISSGATVIGQGTPTGGRAEPTPPAPKPPDPTPPAPKPPKAEPRVEPKPEEPTPPKPTKDSLEPDTKPRKPVVNLTPIVRNTNKPTTPKKNTDDAEKAKAQAAAQKAAQSFKTAMSNIRSGVSSGVDVGPVGVSTGSGPSVGAYSDILRSIYFNNWREPSDATKEDAIVKVSVTIANDGSVISARITKPSGDPAVDKSVQYLIDSVPFIRAFPEDWKEKQKEFKLSFSLKAKRSLG